MIKCYIDLETTGLDCKKHEVIEVSFHISFNRMKISTADFFIKPQKDNISNKTLRLLDLEKKELMFRPEKNIQIESIRMYLMSYVNYYGKMSLIQYSNGFDKKFLIQLLGDKFYYQIFYKQFNMLAYVKKRKKLNSYKLSNVARSFSIKTEDEKLHTASYDTFLLTEIAKKMNIY